MRRLVALAFVPLLTLACGASPPKAPPPKAPPPKAPPPKAPPPKAHGEGAPHHHRGMVKDFNDAQRFARVFDSPKRDAWQKPAEVVKLLDLSPGMTVADVGAGTGYFEAHLATAVGPEGRVLALDVAPGMVDYLKQRIHDEGWGNVEARQVTGSDPGLAPSSVDRILIVDTWHHIPERPAYARKLAAGLKPGGRVVIVDFTLDGPMGPGRQHRLAPEQVTGDLTRAGLTATTLDESLPHQYVVEGRK